MDAISKQRAIDAIRDFQAQITCSFSEMWLNGMNEGFDHAVGVIELMETVDAEPVRHGKYIGTEFDGYADGCPVYYEWKCSECGCVFEEEEPTYNYCPNCGAKMESWKNGRKID